jgi:hypothetical protein
VYKAFICLVVDMASNNLNDRDNKSEGQQLLEVAVYGLALGIALYAIASYMNKKE